MLSLAIYSVAIVVRETVDTWRKNGVTINPTVSGKIFLPILIIIIIITFIHRHHPCTHTSIHGPLPPCSERMFLPSLPPAPNIYRLMQPQNREVGRKLLIYTMLMFTIPIVTFYAFQKYILPAGKAALLWQQQGLIS